MVLASGFVVGESLLGVLLAGLIFGTGNEAPLALVGEGFGVWAQVIGIALFVALASGLFAWLSRSSGTGKPRPH